MAEYIEKDKVLGLLHYNCYEACSAVVAEIESIPSADVAPVRWISVDERLPDGPGHYLICTSINYWHGGCLDKNEGHKHHRNCGTPMGYEGTTKSVLDCYYDITGDWNRVCNGHVTHWMSLPEPPEEDRDGQKFGRRIFSRKTAREV